MKKRDSIEYYDTHWSNERAYKNGYAKGVKEFAERLHKELDFCAYDADDMKCVIDRVKEEMVGADNEC